MKKIISACLLFGLLSFIISSCKNKVDNETKISSNNSDESHNNGQNCMNCHKQGGPGEGWFNLAGSVYKDDLSTPFPKGTIYLYTGPNGSGTLKATVEVDQKGNFYTTEKVDYTGGLFPVFKTANNNQQFMSSSVTTGACNSCHGSSQDRINGF